MIWKLLCFFIYRFPLATYLHCSLGAGGSLLPAKSMLTVSTHYRVEMALGVGLEPYITGLKGRRTDLCTTRAYIRPCLMAQGQWKAKNLKPAKYSGRGTPPYGAAVGLPAAVNVQGRVKDVLI